MTLSKRFSGRLIAATMAVLGAGGRAARADIPFAWGYNLYGEVGDGMTNPLSPDAVPAPTPVSLLSGGVTVISAGGIHSLAILNGAVYSWGANHGGALGNGTTIDSSTPVAVSGLSQRVSAVSGGADFSLAVQDGAVYAWGYNDYGQLGTGSTTPDPGGISTPVAVNALSSGVSAVGAGSQHSIALRGGAVFAWGRNNYGQLGDGTGTLRSTPVAALGLDGGVTAISTTGNFNLALKDGGVYAWGNNDFGQLGNGNDISKPTAAAISSLASGVTAIAAGSYHGLAVRNGAVYSWGLNVDGQLGDGSHTIHYMPVQVDPLDLTDVIAVAAGERSSFALSADGSLWVWGDNSTGELGLGTLTSYTTPQHLLPPAGYLYTAVDSGGGHTLALLTAVPEPGSLALLAAGVTGAFTRRRRSKGFA